MDREKLEEIIAGGVDFRSKKYGKGLGLFKALGCFILGCMVVIGSIQLFYLIYLRGFLSIYTHTFGSQPFGAGFLPGPPIESVQGRIRSIFKTILMVQNTGLLSSHSIWWSGLDSLRIIALIIPWCYLRSRVYVRIYLGFLEVLIFWDFLEYSRRLCIPMVEVFWLYQWVGTFDIAGSSLAHVDVLVTGSVWTDLAIYVLFRMWLSDLPLR